MRQRSNSLSNLGGNVGVELLSAEEIGLSRVRLSGAEMQRRYRSAFSKGERTQEIKEMEMEADEMDLGPPSSVVTSGRRASISRSMVSTPTRSTIPLPNFSNNKSTSSPSASSTQRSIHTTSKSLSTFPSTTPPLAHIPRVRRNSTSAVASTSPSLTSDSTPPPPPPQSPINIDASINAPPSLKTPIIRRPRNTAPKDLSNQGHKPLPPSVRRNFLDKLQNAVNARETAYAVREYLAHPNDFTTESHNAAMAALHRTRTPADPITPIVDIFNQLFDHPSLKPNRGSFTQMLETFIERDTEILRNIVLLENRILKKKLAAKARGVWYHLDPTNTFTSPEERKELVYLQSEDYFTPALKIFNALGPNADTLSNQIINSLAVAAVSRNRIDDATALFGRLEAAPSRYPDGSCYAALIRAFGKEKDQVAVMDIFESYLVARSAGLNQPPSMVETSRSKFSSVATKHRYDTQMAFTEESGSKFVGAVTDTALWSDTIVALFQCGDSVGAVGLIERMMDQPQGRKIPGYPYLESDVYAGVVRGFLSVGDVESAKIWFDRIANPLVAKADFVHPRFYLAIFHAALHATTNLSSEPASIDFLNHVYRSTLARKDINVSTPHYVTIVDVNLAAIYSTDDAALQNKWLDAVLEFQANHAVAHPEVPTSTGLQERIITALGFVGRVDDATKAYLSYADLVLENINSPGLYKTPKQWAVRATSQVATAALGLRPTPDATPQSGFDFSLGSGPNPSLQNITSVVGKINQILRVAYSVEETMSRFKTEASVVEVYLLSKAEANGDVTSLGLSGSQWFTVIEAFAFTALYESRGTLAFDFPGFEPIIDDFAASGAVLVESENYNFSSIVRNLRKTGMSKERILAIISVLDSRVAEAIASGQIDLSKLPAPPKPPVVQAPTPITPPRTNPSPTLSSVLDDRPLPTPPSTPPPYFATLPVPPPQIEVPTATQYQLNGSQEIEFHIREGDSMKAYQFAVDSVSKGSFPHPESLGRLVEALGRDHHLNEVRHAYMMAYKALECLAHNPGAQSQAWVLLEDHMIVALAQIGAIGEVNVHRNRLIAAGSAPSADGYAAMILNMKETTDDAAVALELFEESQRYHVAPNVYLFNTLISKLSRARRSKEAVTYFELMKDVGLVPSSITYGAVINACCKAGDSVTADFLFREMIASPGFRPRVPPYNTMIQFYTQTQPDREKALHYYDQLLAAGVQPTGHTYKLLLDAYGAIGVPDAQSMSDVFDRLIQDKKVTVTGAHWASLVNAWGCVQKDLDRATAIFDSIAHHPSTKNSEVPLPDAVVYESLLNACLANGKPDLCKFYLFTFLSTIRACSNIFRQ